MNLGSYKPLQPGCLEYPKDDNLVCSKCGKTNNLLALRKQVEAQTGKSVIIKSEETK